MKERCALLSKTVRGILRTNLARPVVLRVNCRRGRMVIECTLIHWSNAYLYSANASYKKV